MTRERWQLVKEIFQRASEMGAGERGSFLDDTCGSDVELRREIESLLSAGDEAGTFIENPALEQRADVIAGLPDPAIGTRLGPYQITAVIGQGGMGTVYRAERADGHFHQHAAVKIVRRGMENEFILRRFRHERQILASLDHPNIARLLDGGATANGLPYFVMEFIEGTPIDRYSDGKRLAIDDRLRMFLQVCSAVQHAHSRLVIHRDIKPGNILITAGGVPKLLDFGIARILDPELGSMTNEQTSAGMQAMTPEYASPEQVRGDTITAASDVYSLGVLLYELLTGHRPYRLETNTPVALAQAICSQDPERPSTAVTRPEAVRPTGEDGGEATPATIAAARETGPRELKRRLSGDLDAIILKAMRKDPRGRYASVEDFAGDIERHLRGVPVKARNYPRGYRAAHFIVRHSLTAVVTVTLVLGGIGVAYWNANRPPSRGVLGGSLPSNREAARLYTEGVGKLRVFDTTAARDLLEQAARTDSNHALTHAVLALALKSLGETERARMEAERALGLTANLPREDQLFVEGLSAEATGDWSKAVEVYRALHAVFPDFEYGLRLASAQIRSGRPEEGTATLEEIRKATKTPDPRVDIELAEAASLSGDAERQLRAASRAAEAGTVQRSNILVARARLLEGTALTALNQPARAIRALEEARRIYAGARHFRGVHMVDEALAGIRTPRGR